MSSNIFSMMSILLLPPDSRSATVPLLFRYKAKRLMKMLRFLFPLIKTFPSRNNLGLIRIMEQT